MPVQLNDGWGAAYFQVIVVLLVFALGIPSLFVQAVVPPELRPALRREIAGKRLIIPVLLLFAFAAILFLWILTPAPQAVGDAVAPGSNATARNEGLPPSPPLSSDPSAVPKDQASRARPDSSTRGSPADSPRVRAPARNLASSAARDEKAIAPTRTARSADAPVKPRRPGRTARDYLAAGLVSGLLLLTVWIWWWLSRYNDFEYLITRLEQRASHSLEEQGSIDPVLTDSIVYLGHRTATGYEKLRAITVLTQLSEREASTPSYAGNTLAPLVFGLERVIADLGNEEQLQAFVMLERVLNLTRGRVNSSDEGRVLRVVTRLGAIAAADVTEPSEAVPLYAIRVLSRYPRALYEVGMVCVNSGRFLAALAAVNKMYPANGEASPTDKDSKYMIGLLAHFAAAGESAFAHALSTLQDFGIEPDSGCRDLIDRARTYYIQSGRYETADRLLELRRRLENERGE